ncbi:DNA-binding response regulator [Motiliproteus coralliicola]|uniref:DNA-binding response regulator n=1 Tax=Motiliproteus coralliicola TaxID=2283196 RepID=A0A369WMU0_9GAMM|nr:response regulator [Motiliproteus coralliicola]RDE22533.1 DNA-binding response regulator [Motiliproteus coralliicola]
MSKPAPNGELTIFVVDDDDAFRDSLCWLLESTNRPIQTFESGERFLADYKGTPGCLLLDIRMPGLNGLALQQELNTRGVRLPTLILTGHGDIPMAVTAIKNGALDFVEKPFDDQVLLDHVDKALSLADQWHQEQQQRQQLLQRWDTLSKREKQVMELVVSGSANKVIAESLKISPKTVEVHRARVMSKMEAESLADLVNQAHRIDALSKLLS